MTNPRKEIRFDVDALPELDTMVAISGASHQQEVGGGFCLGFGAAVIIYAGTPR